MTYLESLWVIQYVTHYSLANGLLFSRSLPPLVAASVSSVGPDTLLPSVPLSIADTGRQPSLSAATVASWTVEDDS